MLYDPEPECRHLITPRDYFAIDSDCAVLGSRRSVWIRQYGCRSSGL